MRKVIITAALTGEDYSKEENPNLPEQPGEIIEQALQCREAGAAIVHIHARDKNGKGTMDLDVFREIHDGIKKSSDLIVQLTTGGGPNCPLSLRPEMSTLNTFGAAPRGKGGRPRIIHPRSEIEYVAKRTQAMGVKPEIVVLNYTCLEELENLINEGLVDKPYYINLFLNAPVQGTLEGTPKNVTDIVERLPAGSIFTVGAHGAAQLPLTTMAILLGGHARVGLEDSIYYTPGRLAKSNEELVARTTRIAKELNLEIATPNEAREILQIRA